MPLIRNILAGVLLTTVLSAATAQAAVVGWGKNNAGQLGAGYTSLYSSIPIANNSPSSVKSISSGDGFALALMGDGTVRAWGSNTFGELGTGNQTKTSTPVAVEGLSNVVAVAAGGTHGMALLSNGTVMTWGSDLYGELGNGTTAHGNERDLHSSLVPIPVPHLSDVVGIAAGGANAAAILANGTVETWGEGGAGQIGDGTTVEKPVPTPVAGLTGVKSVVFGGLATHGAHALALLQNGTVDAWGHNVFGQLGDGTTTQRDVPVAVKGLAGVTAISANTSHSLALAGETVMAWGSDSDGQLGFKPSTVCGGVYKAPCATTPVAVLKGASEVAAGYQYSLALVGGTVLGWGMNERGELGNGATANSATPTPVSGITDALGIAAGARSAFALVNGEAPPRAVEVVPGVGSLTVNWSAPEQSECWKIFWRPVARPEPPWSPFRRLPPAARSYTITGLESRPYHILFWSRSFGSRGVTGTPLAG